MYEAGQNIFFNARNENTELVAAASAATQADSVEFSVLPVISNAPGIVVSKITHMKYRQPSNNNMNGSGG